MNKIALAVAGILLAAVLGVAVVLGLRRKPAPPAPPKPAVVSLYLPGPAAPGEPGIHVADVAVKADGALALAAASDAAVAEQLDAAFSAIKAKGALPLLEETEEGLAGSEVAPSDPRYPYAVAAFLRNKTGLKYRVTPAKD